MKTNTMPAFAAEADKTEQQYCAAGSFDTTAAPITGQSTLLDVSCPGAVLQPGWR